MSFDIAKKNRLSAKFDFDLRNWRTELEELRLPRVPHKHGYPRPKPAAGRADVNARSRRR